VEPAATVSPRTSKVWLLRWPEARGPAAGVATPSHYGGRRSEPGAPEPQRSFSYCRQDSQMNQRDDISRRDFLKLLGAVAGGVVLEGCAPGLLTQSAPPSPLHTPPIMPLYTPASAGTRARVGITQASTYDYKLVLKQLQTLFDSIGGLQDVVRPGDKVAIKVNLVGGVVGNVPPPGTTAPESWVTNPVVVRAMGELLRDSGAREIYVVESAWGWDSYVDWGYVDMAKDLGATLIDLNNPDPYNDYASIPVGKDWFIYESFKLNHLLEEVDSLVSVAKMKCHYLLGITQSMKNLIGLAPCKFYERNPGDGNRSAFHGAQNETKTRLPRVVLDLNRARPVNLALIDGIKTVDGSEGPWNHDLHALSPGLLIGGKNPVATDAVAVAAMGFDPSADYPNPPFLRAENHLNIARQLGLGSNRLDDIDVLGARLDEVKMEFQPAW
jgi:uncharacterized protein (DUF362 family)